MTAEATRGRAFHPSVAAGALRAGVFLAGVLILLGAIGVVKTAPATVGESGATSPVGSVPAAVGEPSPSPGSTPWPGSASAPGSSPSPTPESVPQMSGLVQVPLTADCLPCHVSTSGAIEVKPIPALAHPVEGFRDCTACHATDRLVATAPGHTGIQENDCLACHTRSTVSAPHRPHGSDQNQDCLACHGKKAPLPASMAPRAGTTCWLCHQSSSEEPPRLPHQVPADRTCRSCHRAGQVGPLPVDHVGRSESECTLCHQVAANAAPSAPHDLKSRAGLCYFCHGETVSDPARK